VEIIVIDRYLPILANNKRTNYNEARNAGKKQQSNWSC